MLIARFPRLSLAHLPTPLERLDRLTATLEGPTIWMKRDDCTGLAGGGNKTRKLEFLIADALVADATVVLTPGAIQSNHARQTAAACARVGLDCHLVLEDRTGHDDDHLANGNVLLDQLFGATLEVCGAEDDPATVLEDAAARHAALGARPYVIPGGGSNPIGALGYVNAAIELVGQANDIGLDIDHIVHATGSAGTQAGLVAGLTAIRSGIPVLGVSVRANTTAQEVAVLDLALATADHIGATGCLTADDVVVDDDQVGPGYGLATDAMVDAMRLVARTEGIVLDPVYSGKAMAGLIDRIRRGAYDRAEHVVFLHTGGAQSVSAHRDVLGEGRATANRDRS